MKASLVVLAVALTTVTAAGSATQSGLRGTVMRGPTSPVCVAGQPCEEPAAGAVLVFSRSGAVVARVRVRSDGSYRIRLVPGRYVVRGGRRIEPDHVRVVRGSFRHVDFSIDTGIR